MNEGAGQPNTILKRLLRSAVRLSVGVELLAIFLESVLHMKDPIQFDEIVCAQLLFDLLDSPLNGLEIP